MAIATATAIGLALAAASTAATVYNARQTAHKQDQQLASQLRAQASKQKMADEQTRNLLQHEAGLSGNNADAKNTSLAAFTNAIQANKGNATSGLQSQGAVSDAFKKAGSDAALGMATGAGNYAGLVSDIDAPMQTRRNDQRSLDDYANSIDQIKRFSAGDDFLAQMRLKSIRPNPWIGAAASLAGGLGSGMASGAYGGGTAGAQPTQDQYSIY
jgi:hypothetical protein